MLQRFLIFVTIILFAIVPGFETLKQVSAETIDQPEPVVEVNNKRITDSHFPNFNDQIDQLQELEEGTIITRFRHTGSSIMSLFSLSNSNLPDEHFHLYISPSSVGSENRFIDENGERHNIHVSSAETLKEGHVYTLAMVVSKDGYKYFLDGELIKEDKTSPVKFLNAIGDSDSAEVGRTKRSSGGNNYHFNGDIDFLEVYNEPLSDEFLKTVTDETKAKPLSSKPMPEDAYLTDPISLFYPGYMDSNNYRIPALLATEKGTVIAGIDRRVRHGGDSPNDIDSVIRRSLDGGETWEEDGIVINDYPDDASNIDLAFVEDKTTNRVFALVTAFPDGAGLMGGFGNNSYKGTGYKTIDGKKYMFLTDEDENEYTIREEGKVYDETGNPTEYTVDDKRNLYHDGAKIDHIFSATTPLKPYKTSYLDLFYSDDEGKTWEGPIDINNQTKEEWMAFLGTGPGNGIQITQGEHEGRLVFPVYFLNDNFKQASAVVYSDDHGETWHRGESPNEGRFVDNDDVIGEKDFTTTGYEITESQVVEMPDGQLKLFMRNHSGHPQIATSFDGGETWEPEIVTETDLIAPYSQMSAIRYDGNIDGKEAVIFSSANDSQSRINGAIRVGLIEDNGVDHNGHTNYTFDWKYEQLVKEGHYGYSSLTNLGDGKIGLFYEGTPNTVMDFIQFNVDFLKWDSELIVPEPEVKSFKVERKTPPVYRPGEKMRLEVTFDDYALLMGDKSLYGNIGEAEFNFSLVEKVGLNKFVFEGILPEISPGNYDLQLQFSDELDIYNVYGETLNKEKSNAKLVDTLNIRAIGNGRK